jgi:adenylate kinase family enzyme
VQTIPPLSALGSRIMVCGPSNNGKSTLAVAIGRTLDMPVIHVDALRHLPRTDWVQRPDEDFVRLHEAAIAAERWVMDGNYSALFPARLARATGIVMLGANRWANLQRYLRRTVLERHRFGALEGGRDSLKWSMIHWIVVTSPKNLAHYRRTLPKAGLPYVETHSMRELRALYSAWGLTRPS